MADKPSRALILYGDGLARSIDSSHTHLHSLSRIGSCGFLSLPQSPPSGLFNSMSIQGLKIYWDRHSIRTHKPETENERIVRELAHLLDARKVDLKIGDEIDKLEHQTLAAVTISERFMGMKVSIITKNPDLKSFGCKYGCTVSQLTEEPLDDVAFELLNLLGFQEGKSLHNNQFDLILLHIGASENTCDLKDTKHNSDTDYINGLVGEILKFSQPGSEIASRLHFSVVISYRSVSEKDELSLSISVDENQKNSGLSSLYPRQSYMMESGRLRENIRFHCPMLIAQWQDGVTRRDMADAFSFKCFKENGGNLTIPADRLLHEIAFKLWKAPKYGA